MGVDPQKVEETPSLPPLPPFPFPLLRRKPLKGSRESG